MSELEDIVIIGHDVGGYYTDTGYVSSEVASSLGLKPYCEHLDTAMTLDTEVCLTCGLESN